MRKKPPTQQHGNRNLIVVPQSSGTRFPTKIKLSLLSIPAAASRRVLLAVQAWASYLTSPGLSVLIHEWEKIINEVM
jgi:hypothetical protein